MYVTRSSVIESACKEHDLREDLAALTEERVRQSAKFNEVTLERMRAWQAMTEQCAASHDEYVARAQFYIESQEHWESALAYLKVCERAEADLTMELLLL